MNKIIIIGNLGRDAELKMAANTGKAILKWSVCVKRGFKNEDGLDWITCTMFGERAEKISAFLTKGKTVCVEGKLRLGSYEKDGEKKYTTEIFVDNVEFINGTKDSSSNSSGSANKPQTDFGSDVTPIDDGDIPF